MNTIKQKAIELLLSNGHLQTRQSFYFTYAGDIKQCCAVGLLAQLAEEGTYDPASDVQRLGFNPGRLIRLNDKLELSFEEIAELLIEKDDDWWKPGQQL